MTYLERKLADWTSEQIKSQMDEAPRGKKSKLAYLVWAFDLPDKLAKDETLPDKLEAIRYQHEMEERGRAGLYREDIQGWGN